MRFDEDKRYTNKEIIQAMNQLRKGLSSEIGAFGKVLLEVKDTVTILDKWKTRTELEAEIRKEYGKKGTESGDGKTVENLVKAITVLAAAVVTALGYNAIR